MGSILTCLATSAAWCCCTATCSLFKSCCGNDKPSNIPPGPASGRKRSVFLLLLALILMFVFQYGIGYYIADSVNNSMSFLTDNFVRDGWLDGCEKHYFDENDNEENTELLKSCVGNNANYRVGAATTLFFLLAAIASALKPTANRVAWPAKFVLYLILVGITVFIPNEPVFSDIYLNVARIGAALFVMFQQIVILDLAHNWNDSWVEKSNKAEEEEAGSGQKWLGAILISCAILFSGTIAVIIYMFIKFTGCPTNNAFIALTLFFCIALTTAQLTGNEGSLLSSACISAWAAFLCYTAVSQNPDDSCNPKLGEPSPLSIAFGLSVTLISLCWTGWSYTAEDKLRYHKDDEPAEAAEETKTDNDQTKKRDVTGVVTGNDDNYGAMKDDEKAVRQENDDDDDDDDEPDSNEEEEADPSMLSNSWRLNIALAAVACWAAMVLTSWGEIKSDGMLANPSVGRVGMWMVIGSQWFVMTLYFWTLIAPRVFPNRDFS